MPLSQSTPFIGAFTPFKIRVMTVGLCQIKILLMEIYHISHNITVFGNKVKTFPQGVAEAFHDLIKMLPQGDERPYYGLSWCVGNNITYIAAAEQMAEGEASNYACNIYTIKKGEYLSIPVYDWLNKTASIKNVFEEIMKDKRADDQSPAIEMYKNNKEMLCLVAVKRSIESLEEFNSSTQVLLKLANEFDEAQINEVPYEDSWTAAQVILHVTKSNFSIAKAMKLPGEKIKRDAGERVEELRNTFLDYSVKFKSPDFILPGEGPFERTKIIADIERSIDELKGQSKMANLSEAIKHPAFGEITKLELLHFVIFHMQRHTRQLKNILIEKLKVNI
ncbi:MAG: DinB family protein [Panacibacter sp.]